MKPYNSHQQEQFQVVTPETIDSNLIDSLVQYNGSMSAGNMPVDALLPIHFKSPTYTEETIDLARVLHWYGQTQHYHRVRYWSQDEAGVGPALAAEYIDLVNDNWTKGWNKLNSYGDMSGIILPFEAKEGFLVGQAMINARHGLAVVNQGGTRKYTGFDWWTRWAVFVNGQMVAESGHCYPRLENIIIPFSIPVGNQDITIDIRWKSITSDDLQYSTVPNPTTLIEIYGSEIWVRNGFR